MFLVRNSGLINVNDIKQLSETQDKKYGEGILATLQYKDLRYGIRTKNGLINFTCSRLHIFLTYASKYTNCNTYATILNFTEMTHYAYIKVVLTGKILSRKPTFGNTREKDSDGWQKDAHGQRR
jgi:hypothetical protein